MTSTEEHLKKIKEHLEEINDAVEQGIENKPVTIGFHCSACSIQLLELFLHLENKIPIGKVLKHDWFKRPKEEQKKEPLIERKLKVEFENKKEVYDLIYTIEEYRNNLMYGKSGKNQIELILSCFNKLKKIIIRKLEEGGVKVE